jgi:hypothetical protein
MANVMMSRYRFLANLRFSTPSWAILSAIHQLMHPPVPKRRPIGFTADLREKVE